MHEAKLREKMPMTKDESEPKREEDPAKRRVLEAVAVLPAEVRSELIDDLLDTYCSMCAERLDEEGECPEGCDPEDMLDNDDDDDDDDEDDDEGKDTAQ